MRVYWSPDEVEDYRNSDFDDTSHPCSGVYFLERIPTPENPNYGQYPQNGRRHPLIPVCLVVLAGLCVLCGVYLEAEGKQAPGWLGAVAGSCVGAVLTWLSPAG